MIFCDYAGKPPRIRVITFHTRSNLSAWVDLRRLLTDFCRIDDEFERIRVLILFHQLQIGEPFSALYRSIGWELDLCRFEQICGHRVLTVRVKAVRCFHDLRLREAQIVNENVRAIYLAGMSQALEVCLPVPDVL